MPFAICGVFLAKGILESISCIDIERPNMPKITAPITEKGRRKNWWKRAGGKKSFRYETADGKRIKKVSDIERIKSIVIPPAWKDVRINPSPSGKIQALGIDDAGRLQYKYGASFTKKQAKTKYSKLAKFGKQLPKLMKVVNRDLALKGLDRLRVIAAVVKLIDALNFRVGTELSEEQYNTFGLTTLHKKHVTLGSKGRMEFDFVGKSHIAHQKELTDKKTAVVLKELMAVKKGKKVFRYDSGNGKMCRVKPSGVNAYIKEAIGKDFSSKDFRTWNGTLAAAVELEKIGVAETEREAKKNLVSMVKKVAEELGNTPAVCRSSYIHPAIIEGYCSGETIKLNGSRSRSAKEKALLRMLKKAK